jgi:hypothetical protein
MHWTNQASTPQPCVVVVAAGENPMATLGLVAFTALIAAQFLSVVFAAQYRTGLPASDDSHSQGITLIHRVA